MRKLNFLILVGVLAGLAVIATIAMVFDPGAAQRVSIEFLRTTNSAEGTPVDLFVLRNQSSSPVGVSIGRFGSQKRKGWYQVDARSAHYFQVENSIEQEAGAQVNYFRIPNAFENFVRKAKAMVGIQTENPQLYSTNTPPAQTGAVVTF